MSRYSDFEFNNEKTRVQKTLESQLGDLKNYKNASQNFKDLDGASKDQNYFGLENNNNDTLEDGPKLLYNDPRYSQNNSRDTSRKQRNNITNFKMQQTLPGLENNSNLGSFEETNYEDSKFHDLNRNLELSQINRDPFLSQKVEEQESRPNLNDRSGNKSDNKSDNRSDNKSGNKSEIEEEYRPKNKTELNKKTDLNKIINKIKNIVPEEEQLAVLRMPNKKIKASTTKGKILQFKNCSPEVQIMIAHALINIWKDDFSLKKIYSYKGVINFILKNFTDKNNIFFVLFDDENDFISTFAIDTENFAPYISHIFVNPNLRNKGFGTKTLKYAEKYIKKLGFESSGLWCNEELIIFYKKNGYNVDSPLRISESKTVWKMVKNL
jgi:GNAT superfamily N-acetyltransferase